MTKTSYIEKHNGHYRLAGTRVSLDSVVFAFLDGLSAETIAAECFPTLTLKQIYGAITYYLEHRAEIDAYLKETESIHEAEHRAHSEPAFARKMASSRRRVLQR